MKFEHQQPTTACIQTATRIIVADINDRYAESIIKGHVALYDGFEVHGVRNLLEGLSSDETQFEIDNRNPQSFSVYVKLKAGGVDCVADCSDFDDAVDYARQLGKQYGWAVRNFVLDEACSPAVVNSLQ
jgi:hypothetical protein